MKMILKNKLKLSILLVGVILFLQISSVNSEELPGEGIILGEKLITGNGLDYGKGKQGIKIQFTEDNATLNISGNLFTNIVPNIEKKSYIDLGEAGEILEAEFTTNENGGEYSFVEEEIVGIPANIKIKYTIETGLELDFPRDFDFSTFENLWNYIDKGYVETIAGEKIKISDDFELINGEVSIDKDGYLLKRGSANYKQNLLNVNNEENPILIANPKIDLSDCDKNSLKQTATTLEICSSDTGSLFVKILPNHEILNTDYWDNLAVSIRGGDGLIFESGFEQGLAPNLIYKSSENGLTLLNNGLDVFTFDKDGVSMKPPETLKLRDISLGQYQTVNLRYEGLLAGAYNNYEIVGEGGDTVVTINTGGLPVSPFIKDNKRQTIDSLRNLFSSITFEVPNILPIKESAVNEFKNEEMVPPPLVYLVENLIKSDFDNLEDFNSFQFGYAAAVASELGITDLSTLYVPPTEEEREAAAREAAKREMWGLDVLVPSGAYYIGLGLKKLGAEKIGKLITEEIFPLQTVEDFSLSAATGAMGRIRMVGKSPLRTVPRRSGLGKVKLENIEYSEKLLYGVDPISIGNIKVINVWELSGRKGIYITNKEGFMSVKRRFRSKSHTFSRPTDMVDVKFQGVAAPIATRANMWEHYVKGVNRKVY